MSNVPPTLRQLQTLRLLLAAGTRPPSTREMGAALGITCAGAIDHIERLVVKGLVCRGTFRAARNATLTPRGRAVATGARTYVDTPRRCTACKAVRFGVERCPNCRYATATEPA